MSELNLGTGELDWRCNQLLVRRLSLWLIRAQGAGGLKNEMKGTCIEKRLRLRRAVLLLALFLSITIPRKVLRHLALWWRLGQKDDTLKLPALLTFRIVHRECRHPQYSARRRRADISSNHHHPVAISHRSLSHPSLLAS